MSGILSFAKDLLRDLRPHRIAKERRFPGGNYSGELKRYRHREEMHGKGVFRFDTGQVYTGRFKDGVPHGTGSITYKSGASFTGSYTYGKRNGKGVEVYRDGTRYEGDYVRSYNEKSLQLTRPPWHAW